MKRSGAATFERIGGMDLREILLPQILKTENYQCGIYGKWDLGSLRRFLPTSRGFDIFYGFINTGIDYLTPEPNVAGLIAFPPQPFKNRRAPVMSHRMWPATVKCPVPFDCSGNGTAGLLCGTADTRLNIFTHTRHPHVCQSADLDGDVAALVEAAARTVRIDNH